MTVWGHGDTMPKKSPHTETILVCVTFYYPDPKEGGWANAIGGKLVRDQSCAVDPKRFPYGTHVHVVGFGDRIADDTGSAVKSRRAALRRSWDAYNFGRISKELFYQFRDAPVIDVFMPTKEEAVWFSRNNPEFSYAQITYKN